MVSVAEFFVLALRGIGILTVTLGICTGVTYIFDLFTSKCFGKARTVLYAWWVPLVYFCLGTLLCAVATKNLVDLLLRTIFKDMLTANIVSAIVIVCLGLGVYFARLGFRGVKRR